MAHGPLPEFNRGVGHRITAREWNDLQRQVTTLSAGKAGGYHSGVKTAAGTSPSLGKPGAKLQFVMMDEDIGPDRTDQTHWQERKAKPVYWDENFLVWRKDIAADEIYVTGLDSITVIDKEEVLVIQYNEQSGSWTPIDSLRVRIIRTAEDKDGEYPEQDNPVGECPNVYPFVHINTSYKEEKGRQDLTVSTKSGTKPHGYVYQLYDAWPSQAYIPKGSLIIGLQFQNQWYTYSPHSDCEFSSSSSSQSSKSSQSMSFSSESSSSVSVSTSSSTSTLSSSSTSSTSSVSLSFSSSSTSRSSISVSLSSSTSASSHSSSTQQLHSSSSVTVSFSSSTSTGESTQTESVPSSASESSNTLSSQEESSDFVCSDCCIDVVKSLSFDADTCVLTYETAKICFPSSTGICIDDVAC